MLYEMHAIIETKEQLSKLHEHCTDNCFIQIISGNDNYHPKLTNISSIYYRCLNSKGYIFPINHSETFNLDIEDVLEFLKKHNIIYVIDKKFHDYFLPSTLTVSDIQFKSLNKTNKIIKPSEYDTPAHTHFYREHYFRNNINNIIPVVKHLEKWEKVFEHIKPYLDGKINTWFDNTYTEVFRTIEQQGLKISLNKFNHHFEPQFEDYSINKHKIYTSYNLYNLTTRPSNTFNNINFAALPKENGARNAFIPTNDYFIEYDFTAYHPSLIGNLFDYRFSTDPYSDLARLLNTSKEEAKEITFKNLYGGVKEEYRETEYFRQVNGLIRKFWNVYQQENKIKLATGRILHKHDDLSPTKIFNYYVQSLETKSNVELVTKVLDYLEQKKTKIVLYTYDSILVDFSKEDGIETVTMIKQLLESTGYTVKMRKGTDYGF
jgi:hypothetical protein